MVAVDVVLRHFHRLELFEARFLGDFILSTVGVVLEVADIRDVPDVAYLVSQMFQITE